MRRNWIESALFWATFTTGGGTLIAMLLLPSWIEYAQLQQLHADAQRELAEVRGALQTVDKQIEHLQTDPAYIARLARREFGVMPPGAQAITLAHAAPVSATSPGELDPRAAHPAAVRALRDNANLSAALARAARANPLVSVFVLPETRPALMLLAWMLLLSAAVIALPSPRRSGQTTDTAQA